ncbi:MAG: peptidyl-prolyl cis-trans isomerase SurA [Pseudomonadota bacterium]|nr:peptidyl-prolyl cis-trans isomerase SurA [Pseudomonadota bacterium]
MNQFSRLIFGLACMVTTMAMAAPQKLDNIVAVVNDSVITAHELAVRMRDFNRQMTDSGVSLPDESVLRKQVLERMIVDEVQLQLARSQGIQIDDLGLNRVLESMARNNKASLDEMRRLLQQQGVSYEMFREQTRRDLMIRELQKRMVYERIQIPEQEINQFIEQQKQSGGNEKYHLAHILIATPENASPEDIRAAYDQAEKALAHIQSGETFREVALRFSQGRQALEGGDLGWRAASELPPLFIDAARNLNKGDVSTPLRSATGFHIIQLIDKQNTKVVIEQTHARHILLHSDMVTSDEQILKTLQSIRQRLDKGEDFASLATEFSQDPGSKDNGGDLGWVSRGQLVPQFEKVMDSLKPGQISEPFRSPFGWHVLQVLERRQQDNTEQQQRDRAEQSLRERKADEELQLWLRRIRDEAYVEYR